MINLQIQNKVIEAIGSVIEKKLLKELSLQNFIQFRVMKPLISVLKTKLQYVLGM